MLEAISLDCQRGDRLLFSGVDFRVDAGEALHVLGENGCGKTSMLRMLCGLSPPLTGEIRWQGALINTLGEDYHRALCYLGHHNAIKDELTPLENLLTAAHFAEHPLSEGEALEALETFGLAGREDLACRYLSQGQKRRVALARLVSNPQPLWILDEPYVALDTAAIGVVVGLIGAHLQRGGLAVLTTHQPVELPAATVRRLELHAPNRRRGGTH